MNKNLKHFIFLAILLCSTKTYAQEAQLLQAIPTTKEEFINTEKQALATIEWLEHTPLNEQKQKRKDLYPVSYTHLDVYKRQVYNLLLFCRRYGGSVTSST